MTVIVKNNDLLIVSRSKKIKLSMTSNPRFKKNTIEKPDMKFEKIKSQIEERELAEPLN